MSEGTGPRGSGQGGDEDCRPLSREQELASPGPHAECHGKQGQVRLTVTRAAGTMYTPTGNTVPIKRERWALHGLGGCGRGCGTPLW